MRSAKERRNQAWRLLLYTDHERDFQNSVSGGLFLLALPYRKDVPRVNCGEPGLSVVTACKRLARADFARNSWRSREQAPFAYQRKNNEEVEP